MKRNKIMIKTILIIFLFGNFLQSSVGVFAQENQEVSQEVIVNNEESSKLEQDINKENQVEDTHSDVNSEETNTEQPSEEKNNVIQPETTESEKSKEEENNLPFYDPEENRTMAMQAINLRAATIPDFVSLLAKDVQELSGSNDLYGSVMMAQAILESAYGNSELGSAPNYNLFGVKGDYKGQYVEMMTWEEINGEKVKVKAKFRKYPSYKESLQDYVNKLKNGTSWDANYYAGTWKSRTTSYKDATAYLTGRYATDSQYGTKLNQLIATYNLTQYDGIATHLLNEETLVDGQVFNKTLDVKGWSLSQNGIHSVEVLVDGQKAGNAQYGIERPDVYDAFPSFNNPTAGYATKIDTENLPEGKHKITIKSIEQGGHSVAKDVWVEKKGLPQLLEEDTLKENQTVSGTQTLSGWALSSKGMFAVEVLVDGKSVGKATLNQPRLDVYNKYPDYNNKNAGYTYQLDTSKLTDGRHKITIKAIEQGGKSVAKDVWVEKKVLPQLLGEETLKENQVVSDTQTLKGWALSGKGMFAVEILVDGTSVGRATLNQERSDIYNKYPEYNNKNAGYTYQLDTSKLSNGRHKITIKAIEQGGKSIAKDVWVEKKVLPQLLGEETLKENQVVGDAQTLKGWALSGKGMFAVEILVDGTSVGRATLNQERSDIYNKYPEYNNKNAGYTYQLDTSKLSNGRHKITIKAIEQGGKSIAKDVWVEKKALPQLLGEETLKENQVVSDTQTLKGWALSGKGMFAVEILVDGTSIGRATLNQERSDIYNKYPEYNNKNAGYTYQLDTSKLSNGRHKITIKAIEQGGQSIAKDVWVEKKVLPQLLGEETLKENQVVGDAQTLKGWALSGKGMFAVEILVDGTSVGRATLNQERSDIYNKYPEYNNKNAGYTYQLDTSKLTNGRHKITIKAIEQGGKSVAKDVWVEKKVLPQLLMEDELSQNKHVSGTQTVRGWALSSKGMFAVEILVDGKSVGRATLNQQRLDVYNTHPEYNEKNSGYIYQLDTSKLTDGQHRVTIKAIEQGGKSIAKDVDIFVGLPHQLVEEKLVVNQNAGNQIDLSGWSLAEKGIFAVEIIVDGQTVGRANYGVNRPDIYQSYPLYGVQNGGYNYTLDTSKWSTGKHVVTIKSIAQGGKSIARDFPVYKGGSELAGKTIVVDAGHGGSDPGAVVPLVNEKTLNLQVALKLERELKKLGANVIMTRSTDVFVPLNQISTIANNAKPDIFISVHHNSATPAAFGIETYYYNPSAAFSVRGSFDQETHYQSEMELEQEQVLDSIIPFSYQGSTYQRTLDSMKLAQNVQSGLISYTNAYNRGAKHGNFHVIRETNMPAILVEAGFITNPGEVSDLVQNSYQEKLANGIVSGVKQYFK